MLSESIEKVHHTRIWPLRWLANGIFHPISYLFLKKSLHIYFRDEDGIEIIDEKLRDKMERYHRIYEVLDKPYRWWGTYYKFKVSAMESLDGDGWNDYDEYGHPYWDYNWHEDPETGDAWRLIRK